MVKTGDSLVAVKDYFMLHQGYMYEVVSASADWFVVEINKMTQYNFMQAEAKIYFNISVDDETILMNDCASMVKKKCTCGEATLKGHRHSSWCDYV